mmetsp:Transcript_80995/g.127540  ORF Transcript_80995/g.127540 Transcript_80995/m.127540 type:complete len:137 (+) Transcript_80995:66-476(+)
MKAAIAIVHWLLAFAVFAVEGALLRHRGVPSTSDQAPACSLAAHSSNSTLDEQSCMAMVAFAKGHRNQPNISGEVTVDTEWWEDEDCETIVKKLAKLKATEAKCKSEDQKTCWVFLKKILPIYIKHYEHVKADKHC